MPLYVGTQHEPERYWIGRSEDDIREAIDDWRARMAELDDERARVRASRPARTLAAVLPVWDQVVEAASRVMGPQAATLASQATLTAVEHDTLVVTMNSRELGEQMLNQQFTFAGALGQVLGGWWEVRDLGRPQRHQHRAAARYSRPRRVVEDL